MSDDDLRITIEGEEPKGRSIKQIEAETEHYNRQAAQSRAEIAQARQIITQQQRASISSALDSARLAVEQGKTDYAQAMDVGDFAKAAEAQEQIAAGTVRAQRLEEASYYQSTPQAPQQPSDPVEAFAAGRAQRSAD